MMKRSLILLITVLLLSGCSNASINQKMLRLEIQVSTLVEENSKYKADLDEYLYKVNNLTNQINTGQIVDPNRFANKEYVCEISHFGVYSIEFISSDILRVYSGKDEHGNESNAYYRVEEYKTNTFRIVGDVIFSDSDLGRKFNILQSEWINESNPMLKVIEVTYDHNTLYYGNHSDHTCYNKEDKYHCVHESGRFFIVKSP
jgi:outer membrane murein-binding lipoprotein Lpp